MKVILKDKSHSLYAVKTIILKQIGQIYRLRKETQLPDNFLDIVEYVEIDTKFLKKHVEEEDK